MNILTHAEQVKTLVNTEIPSGAIRCDSCLKTHQAQDETHQYIGLLPNVQFCPRVKKFTTWTQLAIPNNFIRIPVDADGNIQLGYIKLESE